jgi:RES domain-containing protein
MFKRWDDYQTFASAVKYSRRYVRTPEAEVFLQAVRNTARKRVLDIKAGRAVWRAQRGSVEFVSDKHDTIDIIAHPPDRMMPRERVGPEGRVNSKGMPCFYGATTRETAMSEVRPWAGEDVSLGLFQVVRSSRLVDCSRFHAKDRWAALLESLSGKQHSPEEIEEAVWTNIDHAFSEPVTESDDLPDYIPTQIVAELFKAEGYDGVAYKSTLTEDGFNLAFFDRTIMKQVSGELFRTERVQYHFSKEPRHTYFINEQGIPTWNVIVAVEPLPKDEK